MARYHPRIEEMNKFIGNRIRNVRLGIGMPRGELAEKINVSHQQLTKYENGDNNFSIGRLVLIAEALKSNLLYFIPNEDTAHLNEEISKGQRKCLELTKNFLKLSNSNQQTAVLDFVRTFAQEVA